VRNVDEILIYVIFTPFCRFCETRVSCLTSVHFQIYDHVTRQVSIHIQRYDDVAKQLSIRCETCVVSYQPQSGFVFIYSVHASKWNSRVFISVYFQVGIRITVSRYETWGAIVLQN
jgi:hypothetical protein